MRLLIYINTADIERAALILAKKKKKKQARERVTCMKHYLPKASFKHFYNYILVLDAFQIKRNQDCILSHLI